MNIIQDPANTIFFSQISLFEITIKQSLNKLPEFTSTISEIYRQGIKDNFMFLQLQNHHLYRYTNVPLFAEHRDPFDRLLIATAYEEESVMLTIDKNFSLYTGFIGVLW
jgi:PIN domain nuclease of toxin-antitoxin system